ncbi:hypothetical protein FH972_002855 [Carpinus fangiana]|uniref:Bulb-type lectin domain-containing protein n=1 Tax=Carpinus fangiana TaxID=176857 RepID=A0A5N6QGJ6_9ROSI|nr:hypothetical protein FH972_002855 [Carpinus fangiana]
MASMPVLLLVLVFLLSVDYANAQTNHSNNISLGSSLSPDANLTSWLSPSRHFAFGFYPHGDGFAIGIWLINQTEKTVTWTANRDDPLVFSNATLELTRDGLQLRIGAVKNIAYIHDTPLNETASAAMLDSGNFVLYNSSSVVHWQTFEQPTDTILGGQNLSTFVSLVSSVSTSNQSSGQFFLYMHYDGNLAAYPRSTYAPSDSFWSSGTNNSGTDVMLTLNRSGVLFLHGDRLGVHILARSHYPDKKNVTIIHRATLDTDGIFRLYSHHFESDNSSSMVVEWSSLANQCEVGGFCGWSSYCSGVGANKAECKCYPGFEFVDTSNKFLGCYRNFNNNDCRRSKDPAMLYRIVPLENILWGDYPYSSEQMKKEDCKISCLKDCNCGAALYTGDSCAKYRLPLRYSRASKSISATAFFKVIRKNIPTPPIALHPETVGPKIERKRGLILVLGITLGSISCLCFMFAIYTIFRYKHQVYRYRTLSENTNLGLIEEFTLRSFSYNELEQATDGFKEELGKGTSGVVYQGTIPGAVGDERTAGYFYLAPEWKLNAFISIKADIYSFGIVLLEIVCCRRSIEVNVPTTDEIILSSWVYDCFMAGELEKLVEDENVDFVTLERMVKVGLWCIQEDPALRPLMKNAILMLEGTMDVPVPPSPVRSLVVS